jgi:hypothetical protein
MPSVEGEGGAVVVSKGLKITEEVVLVALVSLDWLVRVSRYRRSRKIRSRERWPVTKPVNKSTNRRYNGASIVRNHTVPLRGIVGLGRSKGGFL